MDIRLQELILIFVVSLCIALSVICIFIRKYRLLDYDKTRPVSFSRGFTTIAWLLSLIIGLTCLCVLLLSIFEN